jgi:hypothetical protein
LLVVKRGDNREPANGEAKTGLSRGWCRGDEDKVSGIVFMVRLVAVGRGVRGDELLPGTGGRQPGWVGDQTQFPPSSCLGAVRDAGRFFAANFSKRRRRAPIGCAATLYGEALFFDPVADVRPTKNRVALVRGPALRAQNRVPPDTPGQGADMGRTFV